MNPYLKTRELVVNITMAYAQNNAQLCTSCKSLTFVMLRDGYQHPLSYRDTASSGKSCRLCRLIICSVGKLQIARNCYQIESDYDSMSGRLPNLPAVSRGPTLGRGVPPAAETMSIPQELVWRRDQYINTNDGVSMGNYNDGETIKITAPQG